MERSAENKVSSLIGNSGNSEVDLTVNIDIDTKAIAYGIMCSFYAKGDLSEQELEKAIQKLNTLIEQESKKKKGTNYYQDSKPKIFDFPQQQKRKWF